MLLIEDAPTLQFYGNEMAVGYPLTFNSMSGNLPVPAGVYDVQIAPAGEDASK